jgi:outer membrane protein OmpA-like peptidoglycan-associated protein
VEFTLYFVEGKDELADESRQIVTAVYAEIAKRPVPDVLVVGHTDAVGSDQSTIRCRKGVRRSCGPD